MHPVVGGKILAVVKSSDGDSRGLILWNKDGRQLAQSPLDIAGDIEAAQVFGDRLIAVTAGDVVQIDIATLRRVRGRSFAIPKTATTLYEPCPTGVWVVGDKAVWYLDLDGRPAVERSRPLVAVNKPRCPANQGDVKQPCSSGLQFDRTTAIASESGDVVVVDVFKELYPYTGYQGSVDEVWPSTATVLDRDGTVVAQKPLSWMKTTWEWFWTKSGGSQDPLGLPHWGGLVRTRYGTDGLSLGHPTIARGGDFLFLSRGSKDTVLSRLDSRLDTLWKRCIGNLSPAVEAPAWASPILLHDKLCHKFATIKDNGSNEKEKTIEMPDVASELWKNDFKRPRFAIGQSIEGDWLLIAY